MEEEYTDYKVLFDMFDSSVNVVQADDLIGDGEIILEDAVVENGNEFDSDFNDVKKFDLKYDFVIKNDGGIYIRNVIKLLTNKLNRDISVDELFCALIVNSDITKEWLVDWLKSRKIDNITCDNGIVIHQSAKITCDEFLECVKKLKRENNYNRTSFVEYYNSKLFKECKTIQDYFNKAISEDEFDYYEHLYIEEPLKKKYIARLDEYKNCDSSYIQEIENITIDVKGNKQFFRNKKFEKETITKCIEIYKNAHKQTNPTYDDLVQMCNDILFKKVVEGIITPSEYESIKTNKKQIQYYIRLYELDDFIRKMDYKSRKERMEEDVEDAENILNLIN